MITAAKASVGTWLSPRRGTKRLCHCTPRCNDLLEQLANMDLPPRSEMSPAQARERSRLIAERAGPGAEVAGTDDVVIEGPGGPPPLRVYRRQVPVKAETIVCLHGGVGWWEASMSSTPSAASSVWN
jgi:hypothetical protein